MSHTVVTSFTESGYNRYAKAFVDSFRQYWPKEVNLVVYYEGTNPQEGWRFIDEVRDLDNWMEAIKPFNLMTGKVGEKYNINLDAGMVRKAFIEAHAARTFGGKVVWVDSDVVTFAEVPENFIDFTLPDDKVCCYLGRDWMYTESGYIGFNYDHPACEGFLQLYLNIFTSGAIFSQPGWHDCYGFDAARKVMIKNMPEANDYFNDLAAHLPDGVMHPFINSVLGTCLDHRKGPRKDTRSDPKDLVIPRKEVYWTQPEATAPSTEILIAAT